MVGGGPLAHRVTDLGTGGTSVALPSRGRSLALSLLALVALRGGMVLLSLVLVMAILGRGWVGVGASVLAKVGVVLVVVVTCVNPEAAATACIKLIVIGTIIVPPPLRPSGGE